ncbi:MAG: hypothetical protein GY798_20445 [Hyphomicrobiales bacterium]|nr:hypothetical protein [Hyphomicrobiales bacterium]
MARELSSFGAAVLLLLALGGAAAADDGLVCDPITLIGGEKSVAFIDNGAEGVSIGDARAGWRILADEAGTFEGRVHFVATVTEVGADGGGQTLQGDYTIALADGWLSATALYVWNDASEVSQRATGATLMVTGGVGAYGDAEGAVIIEPGDAPRYRFNIDCD